MRLVDGPPLWALCTTHKPARVAEQAPAARREIEAQKRYIRGACRDLGLGPGALDKLIEQSGHNLRAAARVLDRDGPAVLSVLKGRDGWLAGQNAKTERLYAQNAGSAIAGRLDRKATARDAAVRHHTAEVEQQRVRDAVEVPGLFKGDYIDDKRGT